MQEWVVGGFFLAIVVYSLVERRYCFFFWSGWPFLLPRRHNRRDPD